MRFGSIRTDILLGVIQEELDAFKAGDVNSATFPRSLDAVTSEFPSLSSKERVELLRLVLTALTCNTEEKVELVVTAPNSFAIKTRTTLGAINEVLESAQKSIIMTGYSVSEYVSDFLDTVIAKSQKGIVVRLYINKVDNQASLEKLLRYKSRFLQIYNYTNADDKMSALHAKILSVDGKRTLISSANLSYHGMSGNIELGCLVESKKIGRQMDDLFQQLYKEKVFQRILD